MLKIPTKKDEKTNNDLHNITQAEQHEHHTKKTGDETGFTKKLISSCSTSRVTVKQYEHYLKSRARVAQ